MDLPIMASSGMEAMINMPFEVQSKRIRQCNESLKRQVLWRDRWKTVSFLVCR